MNPAFFKRENVLDSPHTITSLLIGPPPPISKRLPTFFVLKGVCTRLE